MKNTWLKLACPFICRSGRTSTPGWWISSTKGAMPALMLGLSQSVRASSRPQSEWCALVVHTFCPLITHWLPRNSARVIAPARSDPDPGSENNWHQVSSQSGSAAATSSSAHRSRAPAALLPPTAGYGPATPTAPIRCISSSDSSRAPSAPRARTSPWPRRHAPSRVDQLAAPLHQPGQGSKFASSQARASARTDASVGSVMITPPRPASSTPGGTSDPPGTPRNSSPA